MPPKKGWKRRASKSLGGKPKAKRTSVQTDENNNNSRKDGQGAQPAESDGGFTKNCPILALPSKCLLRIMSYLSMHELFVVSECSRILRESCNVAAKECGQNRFIFSFPDEDEAEIIKRFGRFLQDIDASGMIPSDQFDMASTLTWLHRCTALKYLTLRKFELNCNWECGRVLGKLEHLTLDHCNLQSSIAYKHGAILQACKKLKSITIVNETSDECVCKEILSYVTALVNIESITFRIRCQCQKTIFTEKNAKKLLRSKKLRHLNIEFGELQNYPAFIDMLSESESLEELVLGVHFLDEDVAFALDQFPTLKSCKIYHLHGDNNNNGEYNHGFDVDTLECELEKFEVVERQAIVGDTNAQFKVKLMRKN